MLCVKAKKIIEAKIKNSYKNIEDDEILKSYFIEAYYFVMSKCIPRVLVKNTLENERVYRQLRDNHFLIIPDEPDFSNENEHLMIDEALSFAVINYVCYLATKCEQTEFLALATRLINEYISKDGEELDGVKTWM